MFTSSETRSHGEAHGEVCYKRQEAILLCKTYKVEESLDSLWYEGPVLEIL